MTNTHHELRSGDVNLWVARYEGQRKDHLVVGDSATLDDHAPAIAMSDTADVEHLGTFEEFEACRDGIDLDLPETVCVPGLLTAEIGRERFWSAVWGGV